MARLIDAVIGHRTIWQKLLHQFQVQQLPHALAFAGPSGIGKRRVAWAFAQGLVCEREPAMAPCGECSSCRRVENKQSESVLFVEPQKGTIKLESTQQVLQFLNLRRLGKARVVIIDGAQSMNPQAANALLKAIEEPPEQTYFILLVSEWSQLLPTLRSRLQRLRFSPLSETEMKTQEELPAWMLRSARGSFEQLESFRDSEVDELRQLTLLYLLSAVEGRRQGLDGLMDRTKDREVAARALQFLQQLLRDWSLLETDDTIHTDLRPKLEALRRPELMQRVTLWRKAFQMEQDLHAHVDRALIFENFFYQAQAAK